MINCTVFAQRLGSNPGTIDESMSAHASSCVSCATLQAELTQFDSAMRVAFDVDVPAGLGQLPVEVTQIEATDNVVPLKRADTQQSSSMNKPMFALAATLLLGVGAFFGFQLSEISNPLPEAVIAHVEHEPNLLKGDWSVVPASRVSAVLTSGHVSLNGDIGTVRHAGLCLFRGNKVAHVVVQSTNGPVTVMLLPQEKTESITSFDEEGYRGVLIPVGEGSIAVISDSEKSTDEVRKNFTDKVAWSI